MASWRENSDVESNIIFISGKDQEYSQPTFSHCRVHYTTLHYTTLRYATLRYASLRYTAPHHRTTAQHNTAHHTTLHYTTLHYTTLHYTTLHYDIMHYIASQCHTAQYKYKIYIYIYIYLIPEEKPTVSPRRNYALRLSCHYMDCQNHVNAGWCVNIVFGPWIGTRFPEMFVIFGID